MIINFKKFNLIKESPDKIKIRKKDSTIKIIKFNRKDAKPFFVTVNDEPLCLEASRSSKDSVVNDSTNFGLTIYLYTKIHIKTISIIIRINPKFLKVNISNGFAISLIWVLIKPTGYYRS